MEKTLPHALEITVPEHIIDKKGNNEYKRGNKLGFGNFGAVYAVKNLKTNKKFAVKVLTNNLNKKDLSEIREVRLQTSLKHENILRCFGHFNFDKVTYLVMDLCRYGSMYALLQRRIRLTEYECRYYLKQLVLGVEYLHQHNIIHRDLKPENFLLSNGMQVKIADFGLAKQLKENEWAESCLGSIPFMSPELLTQKYYSYEVDIWALGISLYNFLLGTLPFSSTTKKQIMKCIQHFKLKLPSYVSTNVAEILQAMLNPNVTERATISDLVTFNFFTQHVVPNKLSTSCLYYSHFDSILLKTSIFQKPSRIPKQFRKLHCTHPDSTKSELQFVPDMVSLSKFLKKIKKKRFIISDSKLFTYQINFSIYWINKWCDYYDINGFAYELSDKSVGIIFNDNTRLIQLADQKTIHYLENMTEEYHLTEQNIWPDIEIKLNLLETFRNLMLDEIKDKISNHDISYMPHKTCKPQVLLWWNTSRATFFYLSNGFLQVDFLNDITIICNKELNIFAYIIDGQIKTFYISDILYNGLSYQLYAKVVYMHKEIIDAINILNN